MNTASSRAGEWYEAHRRGIDLLIAAAVFAYDLMYLTSVHALGEIGTPALVLTIVLSVLMATCFVGRRRAPLPTLALTVGACWVTVLLGFGPSVATMVFQALLLYAAASHLRRRIVVPATLLAILWTVTATAPLIERGWVRIGEAGLLGLCFVVAAMLGVLARSRRRHLEMLQERNLRIAAERDARARAAVAEERARIAREMHDVVSHGLGTMAVMADGAARTVGNDPDRATRAMERVRDTGREALTEMRSMLGVLREDRPGPRAPQPGLADLDTLAETVRRTGPRLDVLVTGTSRELPPGPDLAAYRIVQEATTNACRHGGRTLSTIRVEITYRAEELAIRVADDGGGCTMETPVGVDIPHGAREVAGGTGTRSGTGHGIIGMRERAAAYGGHLTTHSPTDGGFTVRATIPLRPENGVTP